MKHHYWEPPIALYLFLGGLAGGILFLAAIFNTFIVPGYGEIFAFPVFIALFMYNLIDNMPKFVMEGMLPYENQLYFNALYFPAHALLLTVQVVYKPQLVRIANVWAQAKRKRFDIIIIAMLLLVLGPVLLELMEGM